MIKLKDILSEANFYISSKKGLLKSSGSNWKKPQIFKSYKDAVEYISGEKAYWVSDDKGKKVNKYGELEEGKLNEMDINDPILVAIRARKTMLAKNAKIDTNFYFLGM